MITGLTTAGYCDDVLTKRVLTIAANVRIFPVQDRKDGPLRTRVPPKGWKG